MKKIFLIIVLLPMIASSQLKWINVDSLYQPLPVGIHVYKTTDSLDGKANVAYYVSAELKQKQLHFTTDTTSGRRLTPQQFYEKNNQPVVVVNGTFFSFATNQNLNLVMKEGKLVSYTQHAVLNKKDSNYFYVAKSAIGISKKRMADVGWIYTDSAKRWPYVLMNGPSATKGNNSNPSMKEVLSSSKKRKWKMQTAIGGGPNLLKQGEIFITNNDEKMFGGKAINDKHPRTAMGYTKDGKLIILAIEGRFPGNAEGATLPQEAQMLKEIGCWEALNLDGGGSSCLLVNGKPTIKPSDKEGQRAVPAVFIIR